MAYIILVSFKLVHKPWYKQGKQTYIMNIEAPKVQMPRWIMHSQCITNIHSATSSFCCTLHFLVG